MLGADRANSTAQHEGVPASPDLERLPACIGYLAQQDA